MSGDTLIQMPLNQLGLLDSLMNSPESYESGIVVDLSTRPVEELESYTAMVQVGD